MSSRPDPQSPGTDRTTEGEPPFDVRLTPKQRAIYEAAAFETYNILATAIGHTAPLAVFAGIAQSMFPMVVRRIVENENGEAA